MNKEKYLQTVRKQIYFIFDRDAIETELKDHIYESVQDLMEEGISLEEAEEQAVKQMGDPIEVGKLLNKEHQPLLGYLWMFSKVVLIFLVIPAILVTGVGIYGTIRNATPTVVEGSVETITLDIDLDMPTYKVKIDNICKMKSGRYCLTFRMWANLKYSRYIGNTNLFEIRNTSGESLFDGGYGSNTFLSSCGYIHFIWPEDDILCLVCKDGKIIEIDLKEYCNEKK